MYVLLYVYMFLVQIHDLIPDVYVGTPALCSYAHHIMPIFLQLRNMNINIRTLSPQYHVYIDMGICIRIHMQARIQHLHAHLRIRPHPYANVTVVFLPPSPPSPI